MTTIKKLIISTTIITSLASIPTTQTMDRMDRDDQKSPLNSGVNITQADKRLNTVRSQYNNEKRSRRLIEAIKQQDIERAKQLIHAHADVNQVDSKGKTPLKLAVETGNKDLAQLLISAGADISAQDLYNNTDLRLSGAHNHDDITFLLLQHLNESPEQKHNLIDAIQKNDHELARQLIEKKIDINLRDKTGKTPLIHAVRKNHLPLVQSLIDAGAYINAQDGIINSDTALILSTTHGYHDISHLLLQYDDIDVDVINSAGKTALINAIKQGTDIKTIEILLNKSNANHSIDPTAPLLSALERCDIEIITLLVNYGANVNHPKITADFIDTAASKHFKVDGNYYGRKPSLADYKQKCQLVSELIQLLIPAGATHIKERHNQEICRAIEKAKEIKKLAAMHYALEDHELWHQLPQDFVAHIGGTNIMNMIVAYNIDNPAVTKEIERRKKAREIAKTQKWRTSRDQKTASMLHEAAAVREIACAACTYLNDASARSCEMCGTPLKNF